MQSGSETFRHVFTSKETQEILSELLAAAQPFTSGEVVDEVSGTIPLMKRLEDAIATGELLLHYMREMDVMYRAEEAARLLVEAQEILKEMRRMTLPYSTSDIEEKFSDTNARIERLKHQYKADVAQP